MLSLNERLLELRLKVWGLSHTGHPTTDRAGRAVMRNNMVVGIAAPKQLSVRPARNDADTLNSEPKL